MATCWDLRDILGLSMELGSFTCVIEEDSNGYKCQNNVEAEDQKAMDAILDRTTMSMSHEAISKSIEELACRARCKHHQNNVSSRHPSQVDCLSSEWTLLFQESWLAMKREQSRKATEEFKRYELNETLSQIRDMIDQKQKEEVSYS